MEFTALQHEDWFENVHIVSDVGCWAVDEGLLPTLGELRYYIEKPYKFDELYAEWRAWMVAQSTVAA